MCSLAATSTLYLRDLRYAHFYWVQTVCNRRTPKLVHEAYRRNSAVEAAAKQHHESNLANGSAARFVMPEHAACEQLMGKLTSNCSGKSTKSVVPERSLGHSGRVQSDKASPNIILVGALHAKKNLRTHTSVHNKIIHAQCGTHSDTL